MMYLSHGFVEGLLLNLNCKYFAFKDKWLCGNLFQSMILKLKLKMIWKFLLRPNTRNIAECYQKLEKCRYLIRA